MSGYVATKVHGTPTCGCNNNAIFSGRTVFTFPAIIVCRQSIGDSCQYGNMAALLKSLVFVFKISVLSKYRVKYYDL